MSKETYVVEPMKWKNLTESVKIIPDARGGIPEFPSKTGSIRRIVMNPATQEAIDSMLECIRRKRARDITQRLIDALESVLPFVDVQSAGDLSVMAYDRKAAAIRLLKEAKDLRQSTPEQVTEGK